MEEHENYLDVFHKEDMTVIIGNDVDPEEVTAFLEDLYEDSIDKVEIFHETFGAVTSKSINIDDLELNALRVDLLEEELQELEEALEDRNVVEVFDALVDLQYVLDGAFLAFGLAKVKDLGVAEVHRSNMSKLGADGKPIYREDGKILKGPNFKLPDMVTILRNNYKGIK